MKKLFYFLRLILFVIYLICMFLLINKLYNPNIFSNLYFYLNLIYSFVIILSILSKKGIFKNTISYNILNIGIYIYTIMLFIITKKNSVLDIINNTSYFKNNFLMISILLVGIISYSLILNNEKNE